VTSYHIDADLSVRVQHSHGTQFFRVHSASIASASPVWRQKIYGGEYARPETGDWVINMCDTDDNVAGLDVIFSIIHYKFHEIPTRPEIDLLYGIAQVANKYACAHLLVPYTGKWINGFNTAMDQQMGGGTKNLFDTISAPESGDVYEKSLFISWVFGEARWFSDLISCVAYRANPDANSGTLLSGGGVMLEKYGLPSSVIDIIAETRNNAVSKMLSSLKTFYAKLLSEGNITASCRSEHATEGIKKQCHLMQLGLAVSALIQANIHPVPQATQYNGSARSLGLKLLEDLKLTQMWDKDHSTCGLPGKQVADEAMQAADSLSGGIATLLKANAMRSGLYSADQFDNLTESIQTEEEPYLVQSFFSDKTHFKQVEGMELADGLPPIAEEDVFEHSDNTTHEDLLRCNHTSD
ncbi:hypothetical protein QBC39DRAFT_402678, partial [Podospora conica]